ncbi:MAG: S8 family serine peptidase [Acidimicrobiales bacterium]
MTADRPAWSKGSVLLRLDSAPDLDDTYSPDWAFGSSTGAGVRVAIIDSGIDADHPALGDAVDVASSVEFAVDDAGVVTRTDGPHHDVYGHGTACAGIIHALAPDAKLTSVRVLDEGLRGRAAAFHAGLSWAVDNGYDVINLSLGAAKRDWALAFHDTCDRGYFNNSFIVTAANNVHRDSFPSLFASVTSVASNSSEDPLRFHFNPEPPTEFLARGIDVEVPWIDGSTITTTGNSFAAPHIAAFAALIKAAHPELRPFQVKTALWAASANVREATLDLRDRDQLRPPVAVRPPQGGSEPMVGPGGPTRPGPSTPPGHAAMPSQSSPSPAASTPPTTLDERAEIAKLLTDYEIGDLLARGPWGPVYLAKRDGKELAIRRLDPSLASDDRIRQRFAASVRIASELRHPHILPIIELREAEFFAVIAMPLCRSNLAALREEQPLDPPAVVAAVVSLLRGLHIAHAAGIYHGDLRPENALVSDDDRLLLSDVGIAAALTTDVIIGGSRDRVSPWRYLAPEQIHGSALGAFTDVHAAGLLLFELLSGELPYEPVDTFDQLAEQRWTARPRSLAELAPSTPAGLVDLADRAVAPDPASRHRSVAVFAEALLDRATEAFGSGWLEEQRFTLIEE